MTTTPLPAPMSAKDFRASREALGMTQAELAAIIRSDQRTIRRWESGDRKVPGPVGALMEWLVSIRQQAELVCGATDTMPARGAD